MEYTTQWIQTSAYILCIVNNMAETLFFNLKRVDSSAEQLRYGAKQLVAKRQVTVERKCLAAYRDEERMNTLQNRRSFFAFLRLAKAIVKRARNVVRRGKNNACMNNVVDVWHPCTYLQMTNKLKKKIRHKERTLRLVTPISNTHNSTRIFLFIQILHSAF